MNSSTSKARFQQPPPEIYDCVLRRRPACKVIQADDDFCSSHKACRVSAHSCHHPHLRDTQAVPGTLRGNAWNLWGCRMTQIQHLNEQLMGHQPAVSPYFRNNLQPTKALAPGHSFPLESSPPPPMNAGVSACTYKALAASTWPYCLWLTPEEAKVRCPNLMHPKRTILCARLMLSMEAFNYLAFLLISHPALGIIFQSHLALQTSMQGL